SKVALGAQNCSQEAPGAFTGETATEMLADVGCKYVILGHSERRHILKETDDLIAQKTKKALAQGLHVILCVGELLAEREANETDKVLNEQMTGSLAGVAGDSFAKIVIAYEPVWAIGTGKTATPDQAEAAHKYLREWVQSHYNSQIAEKLQILYGGSVKPDNAEELLRQANVDGALVGGASLKVEQFLPIAQAAAKCAKA
ncbi:MAG: triose-phosphate isomerase, partial [Planctomycetales bacterium]